MPKPAASPVPPGFHTVTPHLNVKGAAQFIEFLKAAFGAVELNRAPGPGGKIMHAQLQIGDSMLMVADDFGAEFGLPPMAEGRLPLVMHLYVPDADAAWARALGAGCEVAYPIADQFWGDRYGQVKDPFGIVWGIGSKKEELTPDEAAERQSKMFGGGPS